MPTKICSKCQRELPIENFHLCNQKKDGRTTHCKECYNKYWKEYYNKNKARYVIKEKTYRENFVDWFNQYKITLKCQVCGENHIACLHFHHLNPKEKDCAIAKLVHSKSKIRLLKELKKCVVLCANCHAKEHYNQKHLTNEEIS